MTYEGFAIECYEAGKGLWHARLRLADQQPVTVGGVAFSAIEIGFAWPDPEFRGGRCQESDRPPQAHPIRSGRAGPATGAVGRLGWPRGERHA